MAMPASNGKLCTKLTDMSIGDYISCDYTTSIDGTTIGEFSGLGASQASGELPVIPAVNKGMGKFYFIKVARGLCIADRLVQGSTCADTANKAGVLTGKVMSIGGGVLIRTLSKQERIAYITQSTLEGNCKVADQNVWHCNEASRILEFTQNRQGSKVLSAFEITDTDMSNDITKNTNCGNGVTPYWFEWVPLWNEITMTTAYHGQTPLGTFGWRPCVDYIDNPKSTLIWY